MSVPYAKVALVHYGVMSKRVTTRGIDVNSLSARLLQGLLLLQSWTKYMRETLVFI